MNKMLALILLLPNVGFCDEKNELKPDALVQGNGFYYSSKPEMTVSINTSRLGSMASAISSQKSCMDYENQELRFLENPIVAKFYHEEKDVGSYGAIKFPENNPKEIIKLLVDMKGFVQTNDEGFESSGSGGPVSAFYNSKKLNYYIKYGLYRTDYIKREDGYYPAVIGIGYSIQGSGSSISKGGSANWALFQSSIKNGKVKGVYNVSSFGINNPHKYIGLGKINDSMTNIDDKELSKLIVEVSSILKDTSAQLITLSPEIIKDIKLEPRYIAYGMESIPQRCMKFE